ncbi:hypothetical protein [Pseudomonas aeruginosa]|uniref:hypothetical protein n=1 Tax=Pseudomonas aeruginosa TaxID=287 RepID=UPI003F3E6832
MATTMEDIIYDEMIDSFCAEEIMKKAAKAQCIYIFVEGDSEEAIFQTLLEECGLDFKKTWNRCSKLQWHRKSQKLNPTLEENIESRQANYRDL